MTHEEILKKGAPIEPNCFETDREEQWYRVGLYEGVTANPGHSIADGDFPKESKGDLFNLTLLICMPDGRMFPAYYDIKNNIFADEFNEVIEIAYWMEIPKLPIK